MDLQQLTDHFAIPGVLSFFENEHNLLGVAITTPACTAQIYLQGAHLTAWQPAAQKPVPFAWVCTDGGVAACLRGFGWR